MSLQQLFSKIMQSEKTENRIYIVKCSYFEIYNDQIYDLLNENFQKSSTQLEPLKVIEEPKKKEFYVNNLREVIVESIDECLALLKLGEMNRSYAETKMNHQSSRSHAIYRLNLQSMVKQTQSGSPANLADSPVTNPLTINDDSKSQNSNNASSNNAATAAAMNFQAVLIMHLSVDLISNRPMDY